MIDVSLLGWLLVTLTSPLSLVLLVVALGSVAYIGVTALAAAPPRRGARAIGTGVSACALAAGMIGLRVGAGAGAAVSTAAVGIAAAAALGATAACAWTFGAAGAAALGAARARRRAAALRAGDERRRLLAASQRAYIEGDDLAAETAAADAAVERLRAAIAGLEDARAALEARRDAARGGDGGERGAEDGPRAEQAEEASALAEDLARACDEAATRVSMGRRVLAAAEAAALRIACNAPLRRLLRRRPREAMQALATLGAGAIAQAAASIEAFLGEVRAARAEVAAIAGRRAAGAAGNGAGSGAAEGPASVALGELAAMESAYGALLERLRLSELHASTRASVEQVESAAGALSAAARAAAIDPAALGALVTEIARAESAVAAAAPEAGGSRALAEALAEGSLALDRSDATSLSELIAALRELR
ncbi:MULTISPECIES: hypothetical protein [Sorangium]|uniref:Uncharacterized protein n=2 Tax=Sorangium cellulosum TaxID=56 RepID=A0A4P2R1B3_SORCE|nr:MULTISPECIES: hypothetical protein [Sorangium]AUX36331.1 hypothetical protein SOCE836_085380 [Sorangium cellulosum]WCQ95630.1 hypothetical protein NQZ70_08407 [Sorangium sp. Soce836]